MIHHLEVGDYVGESRIGTGSFAEVLKGYHKITKKQVAIKVVDLDRLSKSNHSNENKLKQHLNSEMKIMKALDHKNIVKMIEFEENKNQIIMILELCEGGDFSKYIRSHKRLSERRAKYFMQQLASGLEFLRLEGIIHRDLKPQNLLLSDTSDRPILKIADFGFARYIDTQSLAQTLCGSPLYMAPEILKLHNYTVKADLWSVGIILYEALAGTPPFEAKNIVSLMQAIESTDHIKFPSHVQISPSCMDLIRGLLQRDPNQRISWEQFFLHPWLGNPPQVPHPLIPNASSSSVPPQQPHPPLLHSKSQPTMPPNNGRNFLHDNKILQQNFNAFTPSSSTNNNNNATNTNTNTNTTTANTTTNANTNTHTLPRSHSASTLPSYKAAPLSSPGNSLVGAASISSSTSTSSSSSFSRNTPPDSKPFQRHTGFNVNNTNSSSNSGAFASPSSLPNSLSNTRYSSSPPKGSPFSTPPISPNTSQTNQKIPYSLAPISTSPPNINFAGYNSNNGSGSGSGHKTVSFAEISPYKPPFSSSDNRVPSSYASRIKPPSYSQKQFLVPKITAANSDSFEKDCVILQNSTNPSSELSIEDQIVDEIEARHKRAFAVSDLGDFKIEAELPYEAFSVYIRGVEKFCQTLDFAKEKASQHCLTTSPRINDLVNSIKDKALLYIKTVEYWKPKLPQDEVVPNADKIIYYHALNMGKIAALDESMGAFSKSEEVYYIAILLLESLLADNCDSDDKGVLQKFIGAFSRRLASVQSKKEFANK